MRKHVVIKIQTLPAVELFKEHAALKHLSSYQGFPRVQGFDQSPTDCILISDRCDLNLDNLFRTGPQLNTPRMICMIGGLAVCCLANLIFLKFTSSASALVGSPLQQVHSCGHPPGEYWHKPGWRIRERSHPRPWHCGRKTKQAEAKRMGYYSPCLC